MIAAIALYLLGVRLGVAMLEVVIGFLVLSGDKDIRKWCDASQKTAAGYIAALFWPLIAAYFALPFTVRWKRGQRKSSAS